MDDEDPNPGHEIEDFMAGQTVAVEFQVHFRNFRTPKRPEGAVDYSFRLQSIYLVRCLHGPDEGLLLTRF